MLYAVRKHNFEQNLQAERKRIKYCFTFGHMNYSLYLRYQHVYLRTLQRDWSKAVAGLDEIGLDGFLSGLPFSSLHGDLTTEIFNGQTKLQAGPHAAGVSTDINKVNNWVQTTHLHAKLQCTFTKKIAIKKSPLVPRSCMCQI